MRAKKVLQIMGIARATLCRYVKEGKIRITVLPNGQYNYSDEDIEKFLNKGIERKTVIYGRVSTNKQKKDLENQIQMLRHFCFSSGIQLHQVFKDIASGISFDKRKEFFLMLDDIVQGKIKTVIVSYKDRLSRIGFDLFTNLFNKYNTNIIVVSEIGSKKLDSEEVFEEIVSLLHCYSMKLYSKRKKPLVKELCKE